MKNYFFIALIAFVGVITLPFGLPLIALAGWLYLRARKSSGGAAATNDLKQRISNFTYNHFHKGSGIGVDSSNQEVHLISSGEYKVYPFSKIRDWETNITTGGLTTYAPTATSALAATADNFRQQRENRANTGLFLNMKDVDHPRWHIEFDPKDVQRQLERWMEILRQEINGSK
jgi:hypothetical protein